MCAHRKLIYVNKMPRKGEKSQDFDAQIEKRYYLCTVISENNIAQIGKGIRGKKDCKGNTRWSGRIVREEKLIKSLITTQTFNNTN